MKHISQTPARWLITGALAIGALSVGARDASGRTINAAFSNPNPGSSSCSIARSGKPYEGYVTGYRNSNPAFVVCDLHSSGATVSNTSCLNSDTFDVYVRDSAVGGASVAAKISNSFGAPIQQAVFVQNGCQNITAFGWMTQ